MKKVGIEGAISSREIDVAWYAIDAAVAAYCEWQVEEFVSAALTWSYLREEFVLSANTMLRVVILIVLASLIWVPLGVWIGLRQRAGPKGSSRWRYSSPPFRPISCSPSPLC